MLTLSNTWVVEDPNKMSLSKLEALGYNQNILLKLSWAYLVATLKYSKSTQKDSHLKLHLILYIFIDIYKYIYVHKIIIKNKQVKLPHCAYRYECSCESHS